MMSIPGGEGVSELQNAANEAKARLKLANEQYNNWKQTLSGALNDKQLICGLGVLVFFYVFYAIFNTATGNDQHEDHITCRCPMLHRQFYQAIVICTIAIIYGKDRLVETLKSATQFRIVVAIPKPLIQGNQLMVISPKPQHLP